MPKPIDLLQAIDEIIPQVAATGRNYQVNEILDWSRYEFFATARGPAGLGDQVFRGIERTFKADWGKARDFYEVPAPAVADRLRDVRSALAAGKLELRRYTVTFDPNTIRVLDSKFKAEAKVMFEIAFTGQAAGSARAPPAQAPAPPPAATEKFCEYCGAPLEVDAVFCFRCGKRQ